MNRFAMSLPTQLLPCLRYNFPFLCLVLFSCKMNQ